MSVNIKVTGGLNIEWGQIDPKATGGLKLENQPLSHREAERSVAFKERRCISVGCLFG